MGGGQLHIGGAGDSGGAIRRPREPLNDVDCWLANGKRRSTVSRCACYCCSNAKCNY